MSVSGRSFWQEIRYRTFREPRSDYRQPERPWIGVYMACVGILGTVFGSAAIIYSFLTYYLPWPYVLFGLIVVLWTAPELLPKSSTKLAGAMRIGASVSALVGIVSGFAILLTAP